VEKVTSRKNFNFLEKTLDNYQIFDIIIHVASLSASKEAADIAELCKGSTTDSDSVCEGSNPSSATKHGPMLGAFFFEVWLSLVERYVRDVEVAGSNPVTSTT
jgi:hypothetical protein